MLPTQHSFLCEPHVPRSVFASPPHPPSGRYNFNAIVRVLDPVELVRFMDRFFTHLDRHCDKYRISKIETVAETYLAASGIYGGTPDCPADKVENMDAHYAVQFGLTALAVAHKIWIYASTRRRLSIKVGVHSGRAIRGMVGATKPQYVLIGDTVNTASRMKSNQPPQPTPSRQN